MTWIDDNFLLTTTYGKRLYHEYVAAEPIVDLHTHLDPLEFANDHRFENLCDLWLRSDHYKWRAMRAAGISEHYVTGTASPYEKFTAWAATVPRLLGNPLYHWTHLELMRLFGIPELLCEATARDIWDQTRALLADQAFSAQGIFRFLSVKGFCTTDDPADALDAHAAVARAGLSCQMRPTFRPDKALAITHRPIFLEWVKRLEISSQVSIGRLDDLLIALQRRHAAFHDAGCRMSDHGLPYCYAEDCDEAQARTIFDKALAGRISSELEVRQFRSFLLDFFARLDARAGWTMQLHLGALRNNNSRLFAQLGPDCGADSIGDWPQASALGRFFDRLDRDGVLPGVIVYVLNPSQYYPVATMLGNFQDGQIPGKMKLGAAWWFLDHVEGIVQQLQVVSQTGLFGNCIGMVTDSRSFASMVRHEYFRRVLCDFLGCEMASGRLPPDLPLIGTLALTLNEKDRHNYVDRPGWICYSAEIWWGERVG